MKKQPRRAPHAATRNRGFTKRSGSTYASVPVRAADRIREAGASVYVWYEQGLLEHTDPSRRWQRLGGAVHALGVVLAAVLTVSALMRSSVLAATVAGAVLVLSLLRYRWSTIPAVASVVVTVAAVTGARYDTSLLTALVLAVTLIVVWKVALHRSRDAALATTMVVAAVTAAFPGNHTWGLLAVALSGVAGVLGDWVAAGSAPWKRVGRMTTAVYRLTPPAPEFQAPWLTRVLALSKKAQDNAPASVAKKRAGAWGERRTALFLLGLRKGRGTRIVHDVTIPGADEANADHVVAARSGWYVIDSKQFGSKDDPGNVVFDRRRGAVVFQNGQGARDVTSSVRTLLWACGAIGHAVGKAAGSPGAPTGILAIHGADVEPGLRMQAPDGTLVDVIPAGRLLARIDGAPAVLNRGDLTQAQFRMSSLRAASHGGAPLVTSPMGSWLSSAGDWYQVDPSQVMAVSSGYNRDRELHNEAYAEDSSAHGSFDAAPSAPSAVVLPHQRNVPTPPHVAASDVWEESPLDLNPTVVNRPWQERDPLAGPMRDVQGSLQEDWLRMQAAPSAAPDDVPPDFRGVGRGALLTHVKFDDSTGDLFAQDVVALRGPCEGVDGPYMWVCTLEQWQAFQDSKLPVRPSSLKVEDLVRRAQ